MSELLFKESASERTKLVYTISIAFLLQAWGEGHLRVRCQGRVAFATAAWTVSLCRVD